MLADCSNRFLEFLPNQDEMSCVGVLISLGRGVCFVFAVMDEMTGRFVYIIVRLQRGSRQGSK